MKLRLNNDGTNVEWKELISIPIKPGILVEPLNNNFYFFGIYNNSEINRLLTKYDSSKDLSFYLYNKFIYIIITPEKNHYVIDLNDNDFDVFIEEITLNKQILFAIIDPEDEVETFHIYNIIL